MSDQSTWLDRLIKGGLAGALGLPSVQEQMAASQAEVEGVRREGGSLTQQLLAGRNNPMLTAFAGSTTGKLGPLMRAAEAAEGPGYALSKMGPVFDDVKDWPSAVERLKDWRAGEVPAALDHPELGAIDVPWGSAGTGIGDGYGLAKMLEFHPEVVDDLPEIIRGLRVESLSPNRAVLNSDQHRAAVRLNWDDEAKTWLLTAYGKK